MSKSVKNVHFGLVQLIKPDDQNKLCNNFKSGCTELNWIMVQCVNQPDNYRLQLLIIDQYVYFPPHIPPSPQCLHHIKTSDLVCLKRKNETTTTTTKVRNKSLTVHSVTNHGNCKFQCSNDKIHFQTNKHEKINLKLETK